MIKVLMVVVNLYKGQGVSSFVMSYFRELDHNAVHMDFALLHDVPTPYYDEIKKAGGKIYILPSLKNFSAHINKCKEILREGNYDVVSDNSLLVTIPMMQCARKYGVPVRILHAHSTRLSSNPVKEKIEKAVLPILKHQCTDFCACGNKAGESFFGREPFTVVPNVISSETAAFDHLKRDEIRRTMNVSDRIVIGSVGRISREKNPFFAVDVIEQVSKKIPNVKYWWIGSGDMDEELREYVKKKGLEDIVQLLGTRNDVSDLYQAMDVFFLPSIFEGLPLTALEAQAYGLPSVISKSVTDEIEYTDLVQFVPLDAPLDEWEQNMEKTIGRMSSRRSYTEELNQSIFSSKGAGERLTALYEKMLQRR